LLISRSKTPGKNGVEAKMDDVGRQKREGGAGKRGDWFRDWTTPTNEVRKNC